MQIRLAKPSDAVAISRLVTGLSRFCTVDPSGLGAEKFLTGLAPLALRRSLRCARYRYYVADDGYALAGTVALRDNAHVFHFFVAERFHRQGIGTRLWQHAMAEALAVGNPGRFTVNSSVFAVPVYASFGFAPLGPQAQSMGVAFVPMVFDQRT